MNTTLSKESSTNESIQAVQGTLFDEKNSHSSAFAFRGTIASNVANITYRQLDHWDRKSIVKPSFFAAQGSGSRRLYSSHDIILLSVAKRLSDLGLGLPKIAIAINQLQKYSSSELTSLTVLSDGHEVFTTNSDSEALAFLRKEPAGFIVSLEPLVNEISEKLKHQPSINLEKQIISSRTGRVLDELTTMRLRQEIEVRKEQNQLIHNL